MTGTKARTLRLISTLAALLVLGQDTASVRATGPGEATLPTGVKAVWELEKAHRDKAAFRKDALTADSVLIVGPDGAAQLADYAPAICQWLKAGGRLLALGFDEADAKSILPGNVKMKKQEHISAYFAPTDRDSLFRGIGPAEIHNRDPRTLPLLIGGATIIGNGVLATTEDANVVFCQMVPWQFEHEAQMNLKRTFRCTARQLTRLLANMGAVSTAPILGRFARPSDRTEQRWLSGLYLDVPGEWDYPYRFFRW